MSWLPGLPATLPAGLPDLADFRPAQAAPHEQVLTRYCQGVGRFSRDKKFINLQMSMSLPDGAPDGHMGGVWEATFSDPAELTAVPPQPQRPFDVPVGPIPAVPPRAETKGTWTFADGSSITAVGPAMSSLTPLEDGSFLFMVATMQWITNGVGLYAGSQGLKSSLGATHIPAGIDLFAPDTDVGAFDAVTIDTFRVMPGRFVGTPQTASASTSAGRAPTSRTTSRVGP